MISTLTSEERRKEGRERGREQGRKKKQRKEGGRREFNYNYIDGDARGFQR